MLRQVGTDGRTTGYVSSSVAARQVAESIVRPYDGAVTSIVG